jgi:large subunit ribosomal protein L4
MPSVTVKGLSGDDAGTADLDDAWFGATPNVALMHQVVTAQLAARRSGTQSTLTRAEVRGGGAKPWKQKGTGRARQGSIRSPQWQGGGVALGPKPRSYAQKTPKKMIRAALVSALSDRASDGRVAVVSDWTLSAPKTSAAVAALRALGLEGRVLVVVSPTDEVAARSFRNLPHVHLLTPGQLNAYDVLCSDWVVFSRDTLPGSRAAVPASATTVSVGGAATGSASADPTTDAGDEA